MAHLRLGDTAPNFDAATTEGDINFHEWAGDHWVVFFLTSFRLYASMYH